MRDILVVSLSTRWAGIAQSAALLLALLLAGHLGLAIQARTGIGVIPLWMPSGIGLAGVLVLGRVFLPFYWLGAFLISAGVKNWPVAAVFATGDTVAACLGWWLLVRVAKMDPEFRRARDVIVFVLFGAVLSTQASGAIGVGSQVALGLIPANAAPSTFVTWWLGNVTGVLVLTPLVLQCSGAWRGKLRKSDRIWEALTVYGAIGVLLLLLAQWRQWDFIEALWTVFPWPLLLWAALRFGGLGAPSAVFLLTGGSVYVFLDAVSQNPAMAHRQLWDLWARTTALSTTGLLVMALEAARGQSDRSLRESEQRHRELVENAAIGIYRSSMDGRILQANPAFLQMVDRTPEELHAGGIRWSQFAPGGDSLGPREAGMRRGEVRGRESLWRRPDGAGVHVRENARAYTDEHGQEYFEGTAEDVTDQRNAERRLSAYMDELTAKNQELSRALEASREATQLKSRFLANMSHEIRTPMNGVLGAADLLRGPNLNQEQQTLVEIILTSAQSLLAILDQILDLSKVEAGRLELEVSRFRVDHLIEQAASLAAVAARSKGLSFALDVEQARGHWVFGDPLRLRQILTNLAGNAVKFTSSGSVRMGVRLLAESAGAARYWFSVEDTGIGIDQGGNPHLFEPFVQADGGDSRRYGGTGLGLAISRQFVELMGGQIGVESEPGKGSRFSFELTLERAPAEDHRIEEPRPVSPPTIASRAGARVLLVEDNRINQRIASRMLVRAGYQVTVADDGQAALEILARDRYDLILMDVQMPVVDGLQAAAIIRGREATGQRTPIIALTASAMASDRDSCLTAGMDDHVTKPITQAELLAAVDRWMAKCRQPVHTGCGDAIS